MTDALASFEELVRAAREQPMPQRLLLVFVKAVLPADASPDQATRFRSRQGGALVPVMYADKGAHELVDFRSLVAEASHTVAALGRGVEADWDLVVVGCLGGHGGEEPAPREVEAALGDLLRAIRTGRPLGHLIAFDRQGEPVRFE